MTEYAIQKAVYELSKVFADQFSNVQDKLAEICISLAKSCQRRPVLPDPPLLTNLAEFQTWEIAIEGKLSVDREALESSEAEFYYVYSRLGPEVQKLIMLDVISAKLIGEEDYEWDHERIMSALRREHGKELRREYRKELIANAVSNPQAVPGGGDQLELDQSATRGIPTLNLGGGGWGRPSWRDSERNGGRG